MCVIGIGVDLVSLARIQAVYARKNTRFVEKILTFDEQRLFVERAEPIRFLASRFAAKEAVAKAVGTGISREFSFQDIDVRPNARGKPILRVFGQLRAVTQRLGVRQLHISLSDDETHAIAIVALVG